MPIYMTKPREMRGKVIFRASNGIQWKHFWTSLRRMEDEVNPIGEHWLVRKWSGGIYHYDGQTNYTGSDLQHFQFKALLDHGSGVDDVVAEICVSENGEKYLLVESRETHTARVQYAEMWPVEMGDEEVRYIVSCFEDAIAAYEEAQKYPRIGKLEEHIYHEDEARDWLWTIWQYLETDSQFSNYKTYKNQFSIMTCFQDTTALLKRHWRMFELTIGFSNMMSESVTALFKRLPKGFIKEVE